MSVNLSLVPLVDYAGQACPICHDEFVDSEGAQVAGHDEHRFCSDCLKRHVIEQIRVDQEANCPCCRIPVREYLPKLMSQAEYAENKGADLALRLREQQEGDEALARQLAPEGEVQNVYNRALNLAPEINPIVAENPAPEGILDIALVKADARKIHEGYRAVLGANDLISKSIDGIINGMTPESIKTDQFLLRRELFKWCLTKNRDQVLNILQNLSVNNDINSVTKEGLKSQLTLIKQTDRLIDPQFVTERSQTLDDGNGRAHKLIEEGFAPEVAELACESKEDRSGILHLVIRQMVNQGFIEEVEPLLKLIESEYLDDLKVFSPQIIIDVCFQLIESGKCKDRLGLIRLIERLNDEKNGKLIFNLSQKAANLRRIVNNSIREGDRTAAKRVTSLIRKLYYSSYFSMDKFRYLDFGLNPKQAERKIIGEELQKCNDLLAAN